jgi:hypothetical protein
MKSSPRLLLLSLLLGSTLLLPGCASNEPTNEYGLTDAEMAAAGPPPSPNARWRKGHYANRGLNTVFVPGQWVTD